MKKSNNNSVYSSPIKQLQSRYQATSNNYNQANNGNDYIVNEKSYNNENFQSRQQPFQTPAKNLAQEEFYKLKALRLEQQIQELKSQNKKLKQNNHELLLDNEIITKQLQKLKNQISGKIMPTIPLLNLDKTHKNNIKSSSISNSQIQTDTHSTPNKNISQTQQIQKLLKQIRLLKNNHELEITNFQQLNKKLRKRIVQLQQKKSTQDLYQQNPLQIDYNMQKLEKIELTQQLNRQKEQNMSLTSQIQNLKSKICTLNQTINKLMENETKTIQKEVDQIRKSRSRRIQGQSQSYNNQRDFINQKLIEIVQNRGKIQSNAHQSIIPQDQMQNQQSQIKLSAISNSDIRRNQYSSRIQNKKFNSLINNEQEVLKLKNQVKSQKLEQETKELQNKNVIQNLKYKIQRLEKQLSDKDQELHQILTKLKPLLNKQNQYSNKDTIEKSVNLRSGMTLLQVFLQKNRMLN